MVHHANRWLEADQDDLRDLELVVDPLTNRCKAVVYVAWNQQRFDYIVRSVDRFSGRQVDDSVCLLYTSDAADE